MILIKLTHANLGKTLYVAKEQIAGFYHSPGHACTHVVATGGAIFPAKESEETIARLLNATVPNPTVQEAQNDPKQSTD